MTDEAMTITEIKPGSIVTRNSASLADRTRRFIVRSIHGDDAWVAPVDANDETVGPVRKMGLRWLAVEGEEG